MSRGKMLLVTDTHAAAAAVVLVHPRRTSRRRRIKIRGEGMEVDMWVRGSRADAIRGFKARVDV